MDTAQAQPALSTTQADEFLLAEYEVIRKESAARLSELWGIEKFALGGAAAIAAWLLTHSENMKAVPIGWWLPLILVVICGIRFGAGMYHLDRVASKHVQSIERHFLGSKGGYEAYFRPLPKIETSAFWVVWIVAFCAAAVLGCTAPTSVAVKVAAIDNAAVCKPDAAK